MKRTLLLSTLSVLLFVCAAAQKPTAPTRIYFDKAGPVHRAKPLVLVDGRETDFQSLVLDPNFIARIDVLKNESAVAKYGEKARDGVILITSKPGTEFYTLADFVNPEKNVNKSVQQIELNGNLLPDMNKLLIERKALSDSTLSARTKIDEKTCDVALANTLVITTQNSHNRQ